jgi:hypothetical protein
MKVKVNAELSPQAKLMLKNIPGVQEIDFIRWFCLKKVVIGGGDLVDYLQALESKRVVK